MFGRYHRPMLRVALSSTLVLLVAGVAQATSDTPRPLVPVPSPEATYSQLVRDVGGSGASGSAPRYGYLRKLDGHLQDVAASRLGGGTTASAIRAARRQGVTASPQGDVLVDVYVSGDIARAEADLRALGMRVNAVSDRAPERMVEGYVPADQLAAAAALGATHAIVSSFSRLESGSVTSEGDAAIDGPQARGLGPNGAGVSVGVISDSINNVAGGIGASQASGDLPASVLDLGDSTDGIDEGRAMAEVVYDEAPGISGIVFANGDGGAASKAAAIDSLVSDGVKVIADDVYYPGEPFFQDAVVAQAVDRAKAAGVAYLVAAGNYANQSWEGTYAPVADPSARSATTEDFDPSAAVDTVQTLGVVPAGDEVDLVLQWAEPWGHAATDFAIDVYAIVGGTPVFQDTVDTDNLVSGVPEEFAQIPANTTFTLGIAIRRVAGTGTPPMKLIDFPSANFPVAIEYATNSGTIGPDAASANGALAVAASDYATPTTPESFSSRGPVTHYFDANGNPLPAPEVRQKPNLAAPDGVSTSVPVTGLSTFFGTSAATPAAAGIAALVRSAKPTMPIDELYAIMTSPQNALDCPAPGSPDTDCGAGFVLADRAVAMALDSTPPVIAPTIAPATPDGTNGWYRGPVTVSWNVSDAGSPVVDQSGCTPQTLGDTSVALTCSAASAGGTTSVPLTIKRDSTAPSAPTIRGIAGHVYARAKLPARAAITCTASDPTSGVDRCAIKGYGTGAGAHTLTAVATNDAGLTSASTLRYTVSKPAAITGLTLSRRGELATLARSGIPIRLRVAEGSTRLALKLVARVPKASGKGTRLITLGHVKRKVGAGVARFKIRLTTNEQRQLGAFAKATLRITVSARSSGAVGATLRASIVVRR
jgi:Subtilase family